MKKTVLYQYIGTNGMILSPVHLEDTYYTRLIELKAEPGFLLTNGNIKRSVIRVPEEEV